VRITRVIIKKARIEKAKARIEKAITINKK
jgi:hypothetical protein